MLTREDIEKRAADYGCEVENLLIKTIALQHKEPTDDEIAKGVMPKGAMKISGMGAVYGNVDRDNDVFAAGAFAQSIAVLKASHKKGRLAMYYNHNYHNALPIGVWTSLEDSGEGVICKGYIDPEGGGSQASQTQNFGAQLIRQINAGAITDLSVTGKIVEREFREDGVRLITKADIREISVVWFGANDRAAITSQSGGKMTTADLLKAIAKSVN